MTEDLASAVLGLNENMIVYWEAGNNSLLEFIVDASTTTARRIDGLERLRHDDPYMSLRLTELTGTPEGEVIRRIKWHGGESGADPVLETLRDLYGRAKAWNRHLDRIVIDLTEDALAERLVEEATWRRRAAETLAEELGLRGPRPPQRLLMAIESHDRSFADYPLLSVASTTIESQSGDDEAEVVILDGNHTWHEMLEVAFGLKDPASSSAGGSAILAEHLGYIDEDIDEWKSQIVSGLTDGPDWLPVHTDDPDLRANDPSP